MIGMMDKGSGTSQVPGQQSQIPGQQVPGMGQGLGAGLAQLFANNQPAVAQGAQTQLPQIAAPQYPGTLMPSPDQAAAATRARMLARNPLPVARPAAAPKRLTNAERYGGGGNR